MSRRVRLSTRLPLALACAAPLLLAGCGSWNPLTWFGPDKPKPAALETVTPKLNASVAWSQRLDGVQFPMGMTVRGDAVVAAATDGTVVAFNAADGRELWRGQAGTKLSAGVGSDGRFAAVVTRDNELVVLDAGKPAWRERLNSRVVTPPLVAGERVFVMGVDRVVHAFDALDGKRIWTLQRPGDALTLAQPGVLAAFKDTLLVGQGARLVGVDPTRGGVRWEVPLATPRGTNEVERLADLVGPSTRAGDTVCARAFQSAVACANGERATLGWTKTIGGIQAVGGDADIVVAGDASDRVSAWFTANGNVAWNHERFLNRALSGALVTPKAVVFGDFEGQVHFLSRDTGETLQRLPTDGSAVVGTPVLAGNVVVVATRNGGLHAFRLE